mmetsp:Transcript_2892/g.7050  ORF Transcript_2892/g.7050 Transcript_2892/m.7050 type:complete len:420 (+) Transcript_2892:108-1367(+)
MKKVVKTRLATLNSTCACACVRTSRPLYSVRMRARPCVHVSPSAPPVSETLCEQVHTHLTERPSCCAGHDSMVCHVVLRSAARCPRANACVRLDLTDLARTSRNDEVLGAAIQGRGATCQVCPNKLPGQGDAQCRGGIPGSCIRPGQHGVRLRVVQHSLKHVRHHGICHGCRLVRMLRHAQLGHDRSDACGRQEHLQLVEQHLPALHAAWRGGAVQVAPTAPRCLNFAECRVLHLERWPHALRPQRQHSHRPQDQPLRHVALNAGQPQAGGHACLKGDVALRKGQHVLKTPPAQRHHKRHARSAAQRTGLVKRQLAPRAALHHGTPKPHPLQPGRVPHTHLHGAGGGQRRHKGVWVRPAVQLALQRNRLAHWPASRGLCKCRPRVRVKPPPGLHMLPQPKEGRQFVVPQDRGALRGTHG